MKLVDLFAGTPGDDPKDRPSGVKLVVEPSAGLLEIVDNFREHGGQTREAALLACAALGAVSKKVVGGIFDALTGGGSSKPRSDEDFATEKADLDARQLVLTKALAKKEALEEARKACDKIGTEISGSTGSPCVPALLCEGAVLRIKQRVAEEVDEAFKKAPTVVDFKRVVGSAAQRECHYKDQNAGVACRTKFVDEERWHRWCAACVCKHALPETWGTS